MGVGQFGVVVQAKQIGTVNDPEKNEVRTVAVKMVKSALNTTSLESLASELKILIHLGPHLNVVNFWVLAPKRSPMVCLIYIFYNTSNFK